MPPFFNWDISVNVMAFFKYCEKFNYFINDDKVKMGFKYSTNVNSNLYSSIQQGILASLPEWNYT